MIDSFGRKIDYARISLTDLCNYRCIYCMPECGIIKKQHNDMLSFEEFESIIIALSKLGFSKIRFTGGEPLVKKGSVDFISNICKKKYVKNVAITTNGSLLLNNIDKLIESGISSINISLDTLDKEKFKLITRGGNIDEVLKCIDYAIGKDISIKLNAVLLKGINDNEIKEYAAFCSERNIQGRYIELMPFCNNEDNNIYNINSKAVISRYQKLKLINSEKISGYNCDYYTFDNGDKIGFISPISNKFCEYCNRIRITADGLLMPCLHNSVMYDLKPYLNNIDNLSEFIKECITKKPLSHQINAGILQKRSMNTIGG